MPQPTPVKETVEQLLDELSLAREALERMAGECEEITSGIKDKKPRNIEIYAAAALLQSFYTAIERSMAAIARDFNSEPPRGPDWHRRLLVAVSSDRPGSRPHVLRRETMTSLERYLRFRHLFRNLYVFNLDWEEMEPLLMRLPRLSKEVCKDLETFSTFLTGLAEVEIEPT